MKQRGQQVDRTRERILRAAREAVLLAPWDQVTLAAVAAEAGVTTQTVLNHFGSKRGLLMAVIDALGAEVNDLRGNIPPGDIGSAVAGLVRQYEVLGDMNVAYVGLAARDPEIAEHVTQARASHRAWLEEVFADPLERAADRGQTVAALYAVTDVGTWKLLRRDLQLSRAQTAEVLERLMRGVVDPPGEG